MPEDHDSGSAFEYEIDVSSSLSADHPYLHLVEQCDRYLAECREFSARTQWKPSETSLVERLPARFSVQSGPKGAWGNTVFTQFVAGKAYLYLAMASCHLKTVRLLLVAKDVRVSLAVITRCLLELDARVNGLLGLDPDKIGDSEAIRTYAARIALERLEDAQQSKKLSDKQANIPGFEGANVQEIADAAKSVEAAELDIRERFHPAEIKKLNGSRPEHRIVLEQSVPGLTAAVPLLAQIKGNDESERSYARHHLDYTYTFLTGSTHPTVSEALRLLGVRDAKSSVVDLVPDMNGTPVDSEQVEYLSRMALSSFLSIWTATARFSGLDAGVDVAEKASMPWLDGLAKPLSEEQ